MGMVYQWKPNSRVPVDPQIAGERLEKIRSRHGGRLTPAAVVKDARPEGSPLHKCFEWNDREAAKHWREEQASHLIRSIAVVFQTDGREAPTVTRAFVNVATEEERYYTAVTVALADPGLRSQVLDRALRELQTFREKYEDLEELAPIFEAMGAVLVAA